MINFRKPRVFLRRRKKIEKDIGNSLRELRAISGVGLHLGAGSTRVDNMINCDLFNPEADQKVDATSLSDFQSETVDLIEHHHMIEHLSLSDFVRAIAEWRRVLKRGGYLVFTCPDITRVCICYLRARLKGALFDSSEEMDYAIKMLVGSQEHDGMFHKNHFDSARVRRLLPQEGFKIEFIAKYPSRQTPSIIVVARKS
jgi:predicted SAM-dependent methyltransferase